MRILRFLGFFLSSVLARPSGHKTIIKEPTPDVFAPKKTGRLGDTPMPSSGGKFRKKKVNRLKFKKKAKLKRRRK